MKDNAKALDRIKMDKFILFIKCLEVVESVTFSEKAEKKLRNQLLQYHNDQRKGKEKSTKGKKKVSSFSS